MSEQRPTCETCDHFESTEPHFGLCRCNPPRLDPKLSHRGTWPLVSARHDWCFKHSDNQVRDETTEDCRERLDLELQEIVNRRLVELRKT